MKIVKLATDREQDLILEAEVSEFLPKRILYRHNDNHIYTLTRDKNGV